MPPPVVIIDTSILLCYLNVPGKNTTGEKSERWDRARATARIHADQQDGKLLVLPLATIIETGNHIAQARDFASAKGLAEIIRKAATASEPWAAFTDQSVLWHTEALLKLADAWPALAAAKLSIGDATIKEVAEYYAQTGRAVEILTTDRQLQAYTPAASVALAIPRRRQGP